jgi:cysteinyl-tRNA synthetase
MKEIKLFNTKTAKKEIFKPKIPSDVKLYTCGPTVYDYAHIGNLRTYVFEDLLKRTLQFLGYKVHHVMNLTDVDDKTIRGAIATEQSLNDYTKKFKLHAVKLDIENRIRITMRA